MSVFEKILVPLDGSENSLHALEKAVEIAKKFDSKITLINIYSISIFRLTPSQVYESGIELWKSGEAILTDGEKIAKAQGVQVEKMLKEGNIAEEILKTTKEGNFDLIVIGAKGMSKMKEILLGSVSHEVTKKAPCPVLIVK